MKYLLPNWAGIDNARTDKGLKPRLALKSRIQSKSNIFHSQIGKRKESSEKYKTAVK